MPVASQTALIATTPAPVPPAGVWCPAITFFDHENDQIDLIEQRRYYRYLSTTGLTGLVVLGTNSEAFLLTRAERSTLIVAAREAVGPRFPIMAGVGQHSTRQVLENIADAADAGADYALVLPPAYFGKATTTAVLFDFFNEIAAKSPLPIVIYNFPAVCNGVDMDTDTIIALTERHNNIVGVKLTCGNVGKIVRLAATFRPWRFSTFGGQSDFLIGGMAAGSVGCIAAMANVCPAAVVRVYTRYKAGHVDEAMAVQRAISLAEQVCRMSVAATKFAVSLTSAKAAGIKDADDKVLPRRPYPPPPESVKAGIKKAVMGLQDALKDVGNEPVVHI
ncbi:hypothetical protein Purlil1_5364 [Purpureocillium lilacinum]|uniref:Dihydrodipicolinate synthetase family protein n=1 Tax=Purpureocillium lilacinum TaxID=33203 RepID=A0ABR0C1H2_PURLI|nr:hypothetical protein Purlil1_5364 [Purpureocillium lilacinum]